MSYVFEVHEKYIAWQSFKFTIEADSPEEATKQMIELVEGDFYHNQDVEEEWIDDFLTRELYEVPDETKYPLKHITTVQL